MHILIPVFFNAPFGGLHENILETSKYLLKKGHLVTAVCKSGPFTEQLISEKIKVIETDFSLPGFSEVISKIKMLHSTFPISLVHAHPFISRHLGMLAAQILGLPCVVTMHGKYLDDLPRNINNLDTLFAVSEGIRQYLIQTNDKIIPEKLHVIPNVINKNLFKKRKEILLNRSGKVVISLITRLDQDKEFILDVFYKAVAHAKINHSGKIHWQIVGQGTLLDEFKDIVEKARGENSVSYTGWLQNEALRDAYYSSDAVIAPGRCVLEALNCGIPAIALGSKAYTGLVDWDNWQLAMFTNFGGVGNKHDDYNAGSIERDIDQLMVSATERERLGDFGYQLVNQFFDESEVNERLLGFYHLIIAANKRNPRAKIPSTEFLELRLRNLQIEQHEPNTINLALHCQPSDGLEFAWYLQKNGEVIEKNFYTPSSQITLSLAGKGCYQVRCFVQDSKKKISFLSSEIWIDNNGLQQKTNLKKENFKNHDLRTDPSFLDNSSFVFDFDFEINDGYVG